MKKSTAIKLVGAAALSTSLLFSSNLTSYAADNSATSKLNSKQSSEYKQLQKEGYAVSVDHAKDGYVSINAYKPVSATESGKVTAQASTKSQTFKVAQKIYYGLKPVGTATGYIKVKYEGTKVTPVGHSLYVDGAYGRKVSYKSGSPGKVYFNFVKVTSNGGMNGTGPVPFNTIFTITSKGKMTFFNDASARN
ncbi:hypothetical protein [Priestia megaterium]|uniref:hypothetical protein n=1 Tax=Priestia megaterium TaxID=1404 RepID=UPI000BFAA26C|nr:hypothetical protein [Priestia megaterium]PFQ76278.1 hypothetical protein COK11_26085 [Priestia megaterium]